MLRKIMVPVQHNLCHWPQNILLDNLLYKKILSNYNKTLAIKRLTVLNSHQFDTNRL